MDYMSRFDFDITYIKGDLNKATDCLSQYYETNTSADIHEPHKYMHADIQLDPAGDDLPNVQFCEVVEQTIEL